MSSFDLYHNVVGLNRIYIFHSRMYILFGGGGVNSKIMFHRDKDNYTMHHC